MAAPLLPPMSRRSSSQSNEVHIGPYKRLESIGKGSFAVVYKAVHPVGSIHVTNILFQAR